MDVGSKLKNLRTNKGITIKVLAAQTGLSIGYISNVERNINNPTISSLQRICEALGTDIGSFFTAPDHSIVSRKQDRAGNVMHTEHGSTYELLPLIQRSFQPSFITVAPGGRYGENNHGHDYEEICTVTEGQISFFLGENRYELVEGDCIYIDSNVPHWMRNMTKQPATTFWVTFYHLG